MDIYEFATELHEIYCEMSHTDMCSWQYELASEDLWSGKYAAHRTYLFWAGNVAEELPEMRYAEIIRVLKAVNAGMVMPYEGKWPN